MAAEGRTLAISLNTLDMSVLEQQHLPAIACSKLTRLSAAIQFSVWTLSIRVKFGEVLFVLMLDLCHAAAGSSRGQPHSSSSWNVSEDEPWRTKAPQRHISSPYAAGPHQQDPSRSHMSTALQEGHIGAFRNRILQTQHNLDTHSDNVPKPHFLKDPVASIKSAPEGHMPVPGAGAYPEPAAAEHCGGLQPDQLQSHEPPSSPPTLQPTPAKSVEQNLAEPLSNLQKPANNETPHGVDASDGSRLRSDSQGASQPIQQQAAETSSHLSGGPTRASSDSPATPRVLGLRSSSQAALQRTHQASEPPPHPAGGTNSTHLHSMDDSGIPGQQSEFPAAHQPLQHQAAPELSTERPCDSPSLLDGLPSPVKESRPSRIAICRPGSPRQFMSGSPGPVATGPWVSANTVGPPPEQVKAQMPARHDRTQENVKAPNEEDPAVEGHGPDVSPSREIDGEPASCSPSDLAEEQAEPSSQHQADQSPLPRPSGHDLSGALPGKPSTFRLSGQTASRGTQDQAAQRPSPSSLEEPDRPCELGSQPSISGLSSQPSRGLHIAQQHVAHVSKPNACPEESAVSLGGPAILSSLPSTSGCLEQPLSALETDQHQRQQSSLPGSSLEQHGIRLGRSASPASNASLRRSPQASVQSHENQDAQRLSLTTSSSSTSSSSNGSSDSSSTSPSGPSSSPALSQQSKHLTGPNQKDPDAQPDNGRTKGKQLLSHDASEHQCKRSGKDRTSAERDKSGQSISKCSPAKAAGHGKFASGRSASGRASSKHQQHLHHASAMPASTPKRSSASPQRKRSRPSDEGSARTSSMHDRKRTAEKQDRPCSRDSPRLPTAGHRSRASSQDRSRDERGHGRQRRLSDSKQRDSESRGGLSADCRRKDNRSSRRRTTPDQEGQHGRSKDVDRPPLRHSAPSGPEDQKSTGCDRWGAVPATGGGIAPMDLMSIR